jgi:hypothetical protein
VNIIIFYLVNYLIFIYIIIQTQFIPFALTCAVFTIFKWK